MFDYKKVGGINFLRMGRFTVSWSFKRKARRARRRGRNMYFKKLGLG